MAQSVFGLGWLHTVDQQKLQPTHPPEPPQPRRRQILLKRILFSFLIPQLYIGLRVVWMLAETELKQFLKQIMIDCFIYIRQLNSYWVRFWL